MDIANVPSNLSTAKGDMPLKETDFYDKVWPFKRGHKFRDEKRNDGC